MIRMGFVDLSASVCRSLILGYDRHILARFVGTSSVCSASLYIRIRPVCRDFERQTNPACEWVINLWWGVSDPHFLFAQAWVSYMLAGGFREAGSGVPLGLVERLERRLRSPPGDGKAEAERGGEVGLRLELEDVARERYHMNSKFGINMYLRLWAGANFCSFFLAWVGREPRGFLFSVAEFVEHGVRPHFFFFLDGNRNP